MQNQSGIVEIFGKKLSPQALCLWVLGILTFNALAAALTFRPEFNDGALTVFNAVSYSESTVNFMNRRHLLKWIYFPFSYLKYFFPEMGPSIPRLFVNFWLAFLPIMLFGMNFYILLKQNRTWLVPPLILTIATCYLSGTVFQVSLVPETFSLALGFLLLLDPSSSAISRRIFFPLLGIASSFIFGYEAFLVFPIMMLVLNWRSLVERRWTLALLSLFSVIGVYFILTTKNWGQLHATLGFTSLEHLFFLFVVAFMFICLFEQKVPRVFELLLLTALAFAFYIATRKKNFIHEISFSIRFFSTACYFAMALFIFSRYGQRPSARSWQLSIATFGIFILYDFYSTRILDAFYSQYKHDVQTQTQSCRQNPYQDYFSPFSSLLVNESSSPSKIIFTNIPGCENACELFIKRESSCFYSYKRIFAREDGRIKLQQLGANE